MNISVEKFQKFLIIFLNSSLKKSYHVLSWEKIFDVFCESSLLLITRIYLERIVDLCNGALS